MTSMKRTLDHGRRELFIAAKNLSRRFHPADPGARRFLFVAGVQRSGTNMMMDILEKSWIVDAYHERDPRAFDNYKMREQAVIDRLVEQSGFPVFAIKSLFELQDLPELMAHFSPAKTLWIVRDVGDTVNSTLKSFSTNLVPRINRALKPDTTEWLGSGMSAATRELLRPLVHAQMRPEDAAAVQWYMRNVLFFEMGFDVREEVLCISYENLVTRPREQIRRFCDFAGIPFVDRMARGIFSSSIGKRRRPELSPEVEGLCSALHQRFRPLF